MEAMINMERLRGQSDVSRIAWTRQKKGFKNDRDLVQGDLVYYQMKEGKLSGTWVMGMIDQVVRSRDGMIRRVVVKYRNFKENFDRGTDRTPRRFLSSKSDQLVKTRVLEVLEQAVEFGS